MTREEKYTYQIYLGYSFLIYITQVIFWGLLMGYMFMKFHKVNDGHFLFLFKEGLRVRRRI